MSGQLQNNTINGEMPIVINRVIIMIIAGEYFRLQFARSYLTEPTFIYFIAKNLVNDK